MDPLDAKAVLSDVVGIDDQYDGRTAVVLRQHGTVARTGGATSHPLFRSQYRSPVATRGVDMLDVSDRSEPVRTSECFPCRHRSAGRFWFIGAGFRLGLLAGSARAAHGHQDNGHARPP